MDLSDLRKEYRLSKLEEADLKEDPFKQFEKWFKEALKSQVLEPSAMALSTVKEDNRPSCRMVLLKRFDETGLYFFTNYESPKAHCLNVNPFGTLTFFWKELERQVIIEGKVSKTSKEISAEYFAKRPRNSQISSAISHQSQPLSSRKILEETAETLAHASEGKSIPCPLFWGGYSLKPDRFEFWQGRENRLHDRFEYVLKGGAWQIQRLYP